MMQKGISHQLYLSTGDYKIIRNQPQNPLMDYAHRARQFFKGAIERNLHEKTSKDIAFALLLGIKDDMDKDLKTAYSTAGAMHVLAVSGLHVGIIQLLLSWALGFLKKRRSGRILFLFTSLSFLWSYAFITGLSPSVIRAVTMFSIILIGQQAVRHHNVYNSLAVSAFLMLLYQPMMIRDVGFQLSYIAVLGIVYLQPKIYWLFQPGNILLEKAWSITSVSIAAQIATAPISLYYFHQFPTYFLVSNLLVIPASFAILLNGLLLLLMSLISEWLSHLLGTILEGLISLLNHCILWINELPASVIDRIWLDPTQVILLYVIIIFLTRLLAIRKPSLLYTCYLCCFAFILSSFMSIAPKFGETRLTFYEVNENLVIDFIEEGDVLTYMADQSVESQTIDRQVEPNRLASGLPRFSKNQLIDFESIDQLGDLIIWKGKRILVLKHSLKHYKMHDIISTDVLVLSGNHYVSVELLQETLQWDTLLIDSTYDYRKAGALSSALSKNLIKHVNLQRDGAVTIAVKN